MKEGDDAKKAERSRLANGWLTGDAYRADGPNPVGNPAFVHAVKECFKVQDSLTVKLRQVAFASFKVQKSPPSAHCLLGFNNYPWACKQVSLV